MIEPVAACIRYSSTCIMLPSFGMVAPRISRFSFTGTLYMLCAKVKEAGIAPPQPRVLRDSGFHCSPHSWSISVSSEAINYRSSYLRAKSVVPSTHTSWVHKFLAGGKLTPSCLSAQCLCSLLKMTCMVMFHTCIESGPPCRKAWKGSFAHRFFGNPYTYGWTIMSMVSLIHAATR